VLQAIPVTGHELAVASESRGPMPAAEHDGAVPRRNDKRLRAYVNGRSSTTSVQSGSTAPRPTIL